MSQDAIAIIGLAVRFPGADCVEAFWRNLRGGVESTTFFSEAQLRAAGVDPALLTDPRYVKANGVLQGAEEFDAEFFGLTPREAEITDPQHRVFLELAWTALERAGYDATRLAARTGVFAGAGLSTYLLKNLAPNRALVESVGELALLLGNNKDFVPTRVSYKLNLRGPSIAVNSACSTSLVAVHLACQSLLDFHCDLALAGGVSVQVPQAQGYLHQDGGIGSPDGHCRAFDAQAHGTVGGNGAGIVVLKRLAEALADGDTIHAVIRGSAVNNDGAAKVGFTAPSVEGQAQVVAEALAVAGVEPRDISYIEAHGTGTDLGDPIEVAALTEVFAQRTTDRGFCAIGSVKTNFGHLDEAAGVAGLVKTILALEHREVPPSLHFTAPNPKIDFAAGPFYVNARLAAWPAAAGQPRRAGVSSFGIGGTNAHVVLEEAPLPAPTTGGDAPQLLVLSARTPAALGRAVENLAEHLERHPDLILADVAYTLALGRRAFEHRRWIVARTGSEAATLLRGQAATLNTGATSRDYASVVAAGINSSGLTPLIDIGRGWAAGGTVDWAAFYAGQKRRHVPLPTYPFERRRHWIEARPPAPEAAPAPAKPAADVASWFYVPRWERSHLPEPSSGTMRYLLFLDRGGVGAALAEQLAAQGREVSTVRDGAGFTLIGPRAYAIDPERGDDYRALWAAMPRPPDRVVYLASLSPAAAETVPGFEGLLHLARAAGALAAPLQIIVVSAGAWPVADGEPLQPGQAALAGPVRVIPLEYPDLSCRQVDIALSDESAMADLLAEVAGGAEEPAVAYRRGARWVQTLAPQPLPPASERPARLREGGVYVITGGLGSMGLAFARELARTARARLVLIGRSAPTPEKRRVLAELESLGAEVLVAAADVADPAQMRTVIAQALARFGAVHGVIHAAGVLGQGSIHAKTRALAEATFAPKIAGVRALAAALEDTRLDFFLICSSLAALRPILGQADYAAANAFLDAFAADHARRTGTPTISIGWGMWQELGLVENARLPPEMKRAIRDEIEREGWQGAGVDVLRRVLAHGSAPHILISPQPLVAPRPLAHPLLTERREESGRIVYVARLQPSRHWVVDEHRFDGQAVLPGTAYLELARAAVADRLGAGPMELSEIYFLQPLLFAGDEAKEVRVVLQGDAFHILSRVGEDRWQEHARGQARRLPEPSVPAPPAPSLGVLSAAPLPVDAVHFGPRWHNLRQMAFGDSAGEAELELPAEFQADIDVYLLHPALLDMATGFITVRHPLPGALPFSYGRLVMHRPLPARLRSRVRITERTGAALEMDATLCDEHGAVLVEIEGYRLQRAAAPAPAAQPDNVRLALGTQGLLESLVLAPAARRAPGPGEVEIRVEAAGLNFIEVLYALGLLPPAAGLEAMFGLECAGRVARVGAGVTAFGEGDAVIACAPGSFSLYVTAPAAAVALRPPALSAAAAATIPAAFATAYHALITLGRLAAGERVLIHAATGGVGLAAVQIAQGVGAEIFATAGSPEKREFLRTLGVKHIMDSRSLAFAGEIAALTQGAGVDVVLNSLGGEFLAKGLEALAPHGRFLELGKRDIFKGGTLDLRPFAKIISFIVVDVTPEMPKFAALWGEVTRRLLVGEIRPLPHRAFPLAEARSAFEFMARAGHIGKIVLTMEEAGELLRPGRLRPVPAGRTLAAILGGAEPPADAPTGQRAPRPELASAYAEPRSEIEGALVGIWADLLGFDRVGIHDDFFDLNGDSLLAAQVMARLHAAAQVQLPLNAIFDQPTIAGLAARAEAARELRRPVPVVPAGGEEEGTL